MPVARQAFGDLAAEEAAAAQYRYSHATLLVGGFIYPVSRGVWESIWLFPRRRPNITVIQTGPGIDKIVVEGDSYWIFGTSDGPLAGKKVEIPKDNVAAIQWKIADEPTQA